MTRGCLCTVAIALLVSDAARAQLPVPTRKVSFRAVDLRIGESQEVSFDNGQKVLLKLIDLREQRDPLCNAVRRAEVDVEVGAHKQTLVSGNYRLPVVVGNVQIDCPVTSGYTRNSNPTTNGLDAWGLEKDARLRVWPVGEPLIEPGTFMYPAAQRWFASATQMANEPVFVDGGERPGSRQIYYHYGLDMGGAEGLVDVKAATNGLVVSVGNDTLPGYENTPVAPRYDVVYLLDERGWFYRYSHLHTILAEVRPGRTIAMGEKLGLLGKEGGSGGWSHLHFDISGRQPSGRWGIVEGYAFLWEAYQREFKPALIAVARPHYLAAVGESITVDGTRSWSATGKIESYEWKFTDGTTATGPTAKRSYARPGVYSEILKVADGAGQIDYDFAIVNVLDKSKPDPLPPSIHAVYSPTRNIQPGQSVTFLVRTFRTTDGEETWDFGDGSPPVTVKSDGNVKPLAKDGYAATQHQFARPGLYLVRVQRTDRSGSTAMFHLKVHVGSD